MPQSEVRAPSARSASRRIDPAMELDPESMGARDLYHWMIHTIVPRPIAWVSTISPAGVSNLAPFSFFAPVCARPPILMFCPANDRHGRPKDTLRNLRDVPEFVVNLVSSELTAVMDATAANLPQGESEFATFGVEPAGSAIVRPPRVALSPVAYECRLDRVVTFSEGPIGGHAVFGRVVRVVVADWILGPDGRPETIQLDLVARRGGSEYVRGGERVTLSTSARPGAPR